MNDSNRRVAIIGGASKGLGKGCAESLAKAGIDIVLCARNKEKVEQSANEIRTLGVNVLPLAVDMSSASDNEMIVQETLKKFGRIDILINNSGGPPAGNFKQFSNEDWMNAFHSVLMYAIRMTNLTLPHMQKNGWGRIINIAS